MLERNKRKAQYNIDPIFLDRWSPRSFKEDPIPEEILFGVLEAASWAPSASNNQPWRFQIARTEEDRNKFYKFINEGNLLWCKKAPTLRLIMSKKTTERGPNITDAFDTGTAWGFLAIEAAKKGLITHAMGGFQKDKAKEILQIPEDYELHAVVAIGYQGERSDLPENLQQRETPSQRRPLHETVFEGEFGKGILE